MRTFAVSPSLTTSDLIEAGLTDQVHVGTEVPYSKKSVDAAKLDVVIKDFDFWRSSLRMRMFEGCDAVGNVADGCVVSNLMDEKWGV